MIIYQSKKQYELQSKKLAEIFGVEYKPTSLSDNDFPMIIECFGEKITNPKHSEFMKGSNNPNYGKPKTDDIKRKMSISNTGVKRKEATKLKCSELAKQRWKNNPIKRKPLTDEQKKLISEKTKLALQNKKV